MSEAVKSIVEANSERAESLREKIARFLGARTPLITEMGPISDGSLHVSFRKQPIDPVTGNVIDTDWHPTYSGKQISIDEVETYVKKGYDCQPDGFNAKSAWIMREQPIPVIVDEYGNETCFEPTKEQLETLSLAYEDDSLIHGMIADQYSFRLAQEGSRVIDRAFRNGLRDEVAIARLFRDDIRDIEAQFDNPKTRARQVLSHKIHMVVGGYSNMHTVDESRKVTVFEQGEK